MDKTLDQSDDQEKSFRFVLQERSDVEKFAQLKVIRDIDEALQNFDETDEDTSIKFVVKTQVTPVEPPPIPTDLEVHGYLLQNALLLVDCGEFSLARNVLGDILRRNNNHVDAIRWMGWCFKQENQLDNARKCYEQLVQRRVTEQDLFELGEIYYLLKRDADAQSTWLDALGQCDAESPRLFDLHKNLGNVFTRLADYESAEENYNKALTIRPLSDILNVNLGSLNFQRAQYTQALEYFKKGLELNPFNDRAWCGVALVAREMKDDEWALSVLLRCLDINPHNQVALQVLISWGQTDCDWSVAIERVHVYLENNQDDGEMIYSLAGLYFQTGSLIEAELELTRLDVLHPGRTDVQELKELIMKKKEASL
ncbi:MAG: tetratricopeptide repeat protein [Oligoflexia bacterium]|nr:tetratricopeptide repeat protein [Oligoflexia bacterium]